MPATMIEAPEADIDVAPRPLSDEQITKDRAAAPQRQRLPPLPEAPMDAAEHEVIGQPSAAFNDMADKLEKAMKGVLQQSPTAPEPKAVTSEQVPSDKTKTTDAKAPAAPAEIAPEDKTITGAKAADWNFVKEKNKRLEAEVKEFSQKHALVTKEYDEFKKKAVDMAKMEEAEKRIATLQAERDTFKGHLEQVALERSDEFRARYDRLFTDAVAKAKDAVGAAQGEKIENLLQMAPSKWRKEQINAIREELNGVDQDQLGRAMDQYDDARKEREAALKDKEGTYQKLLGLQAEKANRVRELETHRITAAVESVLALARENFESFKAGDKEEQKAIVQSNEEKVRQFFNGKLDGHALALLPLHSAEYERLTKDVIPELSKTIKELEATVAKYEESANPGPSGGGGQGGSDGGKESGFIDTFNRHWPQGNR